MSYRGPQHNRITLQRREVMQHAGHTVTWKQYVSASTGSPLLGIGDTLYYRQQAISAHMVYSANTEQQVNGGQMVGQTLYAVTYQTLGIQDELVWNGDVYRIQSQSQPSKIAGQWNTRLEKGDS